MSRGHGIDYRVKDMEMKADRVHEFSVRARQVYDRRWRRRLEAQAQGQFVAIEPDSGDCYLGRTPLEAIDKGKEMHPGKVFHVMKVGAKAAVLLKWADECPTH